MNPDLDPPPDQTPFFVDLKEAKKLIFPHIFSDNLPVGRHIIISLKNLLFC